MDEPMNQVSVPPDDLRGFIECLLNSGFTVVVEATGDALSEIRMASSSGHANKQSGSSLKDSQSAYAELSNAHDGFRLTTTGEKMSELLQERLTIVQES